jgi:hypothetical protein
MEEKKKGISYIVFRICRWIIKTVYPKTTVEGLENLPDAPCIVVGNHTKMNGPICGEIYFPGKRKIWCAHQMMYLKEVPAYTFEDFWSLKPKWTHWFYHLASYVITPIAVCLFRNAKTIPVYRDNRLITTFKLTISALEENTNVIIFPECYTPYNNIVYQFQDKFIDVAKLYYKRTGKAVPFVPLYVAPNLKKMYIGKPIVFDPTAPIDQERKRITDYLMETITEIAVNLPEHTVVPYPNVSAKHYPKNIPLEVKK